MTEPEDLMDATYRALCRHGYAELTMQDIADAADRSTAALHYHYDTKHDLLVAFLDHLFADARERIEGVTAEGTPRDRLAAFLDETLSRPREDDRGLATAMLEMKAQAPYDGAFRERLAAFDEFLRARVRDIVTDGVESGEFRADVDPDAAASFVVTAVSGAYVREVAVGRSPERTRRTLRRYVEADLLAGADS